ncbi:MAG: HmuY family protein [Polyangiaceae bacterium]|nr:HmuY family protein [Polyangiaceae bacterium]
MRASTPLLSLALSCALAGALGCSSDDSAGSGGSGGSGGGSGTTTGTDVQPVCTEPAAVPCSDQVILQMNLQSDVAPGLISSQPDGATGWTSMIDATAGGAFASDPDSYVYGRFTDSGLEKVAISDEQSLDSMDWDIAFRRYVVRINSGHSGPSCVGAIRIPGDPAYEDVTAPPNGVTYHTDDYFTSESCELIPDGSGLEGSPATALSGYWTYPGCVAMSGYTYAVQLASGRTLKLVVDSYYSPDVQEQCDTSGSIPASNTGSANFQIRWAFLQ